MSSGVEGVIEAWAFHLGRFLWVWGSTIPSSFSAIWWVGEAFGVVGVVGKDGERIAFEYTF